MRVGLIGYSGERPPVGGVAGGGPVDPGDPPVPETPPEPLTLVLADGDEFRKTEYMALGYNRFDVMCIGAAAGKPGFVMQHMPATIYAGNGYLPITLHQWKFAGGAGAGGVQRVQGRLRLLPSLARVVVGAPGVDGAEHSFIEPELPFQGATWPNRSHFPARDVPLGTEGGASSFGGTICRASGGLPGVASGGGGNAGKGGTTVVGGGPNPTTYTKPGYGGTGTTAPNGAWDGKTGSGGGGGPSRSYGAYGRAITEIQGYSLFPEDGDGGKSPMGAVAGGPIGTLNTPYQYYVYDPVNGDRVDSVTVDVPSTGGAGAGPTAAPLNGDTTQYGTQKPGAHPEGLVIIRLTYEVL